MCYKILCVLFLAAVFWTGCRDDAETPKIEKLEFIERSRTMKMGERAAVGIKISPESAKSSEKIRYSTVGANIVEIDEALSSNDGVVFTAVGGGSTIITAKANGIVEYLEVTVEGSAESSVPYITVTDSVLEIPMGTKKHFMATLQNGTPND
jgi:hypothetical protein